MLKKLKHLIGRVINKLIIPSISSRYRTGWEYFNHTVFFGYEPEVRYIKKYCRKSAIAIDVGANMGLWTYGMIKSKLFGKIISFEPNLTLTKNLEAAGFKNVSVIHKAVSSINGQSVLRIPTQGNVLLSGWASLEDQIDLSGVTFQQLAVPIIRLDDLNLSGVGFIKIDVEGHELKVLEGGRILLAESKPVCMVECRARNFQEVEAYFHGLGVGYRCVNTVSRFGFALSGENHLFSVT